MTDIETIETEMNEERVIAKEMKKTVAPETVTTTTIEKTGPVEAITQVQNVIQNI